MAVVSIEDGRVEGDSTTTGLVFHGVPYATSPVGVARFQPPVRPVRWSGVRDGTRPGGTAPQPPRSRIGDLDLSPFFAPGWVQDEDFLTVSVWTPGLDADAPVVVFLHGGAFIAGSACAAMYDGSTFARDGVVFVGVQYRLGLQGFLHLPDAPDDRGLLDVVAALEWVQRNIAAFGGDPARVTVMGQSAGAILVQALRGLPAASGLFQRSISQSGSPFGVLHPTQAAPVADAVGSVLGRAATAAALSDLPDAALVDSVAALGAVDLSGTGLRAPLDGIIRLGLVREHPLLDGLRNGWASEVPMLLGANLDESALYPDPDADDPNPEAALLKTATRLSGDADRLARVYRASMEGDLAAARLSLRSDGMFGAGTRAAAGALAAAGAPTFLYEFDWRSSALDGRLGASHLMELPFVFDRVELAALHGPHALLGVRGAAAGLAARMHAAWVAFIRDGDPGWTAYEPGRRVVQRIGDEWTEAPDHRGPALVAWG